MSSAAPPLSWISLLDGLNIGLRTHLSVELRCAIQDDLVVQAFRSLRREHHAKPVLARLRNQRQRAGLARGSAPGRREVLCLVEHIKPAGRTGASLDEGE